MTIIVGNVEVDEVSIKALCRRFRVHELALFGSTAKGVSTPASDVDLLVEFEPDAQVGFIALSRLQRELASLFHRPVDLVSKPGLKPAIRNEVLASARILYAA